MQIYIDESGNTGNHVFDEQQPHMTMGYLITELACPAEVREKHMAMLRSNGAQELKGRKWPRTTRRRERIVHEARRFTDQCGKCDCGGAIVEKPFIVLARIAEDIVLNPPLEDHIVEWWQEGGRFELIEAIENEVPVAWRKDAWETTKGTTDERDLPLLGMNRRIRRKMLTKMRGMANLSEQAETTLRRAQQESHRAKIGTRLQSEDTRNGPDIICSGSVGALIALSLRRMGKGAEGIETITIDQTDEEKDKARRQLVSIALTITWDRMGKPVQTLPSMTDKTERELKNLYKRTLALQGEMERRIEAGKSNENPGIQWADVIASGLRKKGTGREMYAEEQEVLEMFSHGGSILMDVFTKEAAKQRSRGGERKGWNTVPTQELKNVKEMQEMVTGEEVAE